MFVIKALHLWLERMQRGKVNNARIKTGNLVSDFRLLKYLQVICKPLTGITREICERPWWSWTIMIWLKQIKKRETGQLREQKPNIICWKIKSRLCDKLQECILMDWFCYYKGEKRKGNSMAQWIVASR